MCKMLALSTRVKTIWRNTQHKNRFFFLSRYGGGSPRSLKVSRRYESQSVCLTRRGSTDSLHTQTARGFLSARDRQHRTGRHRPTAGMTCSLALTWSLAKASRKCQKSMGRKKSLRFSYLVAFYNPKYENCCNCRFSPNLLIGAESLFR